MTSTAHIQRDFARRIRQPEHSETTSADEKRRMAIYQSLFFNNIMGFIHSGFPVLNSVLEAEKLTALGRAFFAAHNAQSPYFSDIGKEFVTFVSHYDVEQARLPVWLAELAHYEWLELDIGIRSAQQVGRYYTPGAALPGHVQMSSHAALVSYQYPVHLIGPDFCPLPAAMGAYYYVVYRTESCAVKFLQVNLHTAFLLQNSASAQSVNELFHRLLAAMPDTRAEALRTAFFDTLRHLLTLQILMIADVQNG